MSEHLKDTDKVFSHGVKFPSQDKRHEIQGQADNKQGNSDIHGKGDHKDIELGKDSGEDTQY